MSKTAIAPRVVLPLSAPLVCDQTVVWGLLQTVISLCVRETRETRNKILSKLPPLPPPPPLLIIR